MTIRACHRRALRAVDRMNAALKTGDRVRMLQALREALDSERLALSRANAADAPLAQRTALAQNVVGLEQCFRAAVMRGRA